MYVAIDNKTGKWHEFTWTADNNLIFDKTQQIVNPDDYTITEVDEQDFENEQLT